MVSKMIPAGHREGSKIQAYIGNYGKEATELARARELASRCCAQDDERRPILKGHTYRNPFDESRREGDA